MGHRVWVEVAWCRITQAWTHKPSQQLGSLRTWKTSAGERTWFQENTLFSFSYSAFSNIMGVGIGNHLPFFFFFNKVFYSPGFMVSCQDFKLHLSSMHVGAGNIGVWSSSIKHGECQADVGRRGMSAASCVAFRVFLTAVTWGKGGRQISQIHVFRSLGVS